MEVIPKGTRNNPRRHRNCNFERLSGPKLFKTISTIDRLEHLGCRSPTSSKNGMTTYNLEHASGLGAIVQMIPKQTIWNLQTTPSEGFCIPGLSKRHLPQGLDLPGFFKRHPPRLLGLPGVSKRHLPKGLSLIRAKCWTSGGIFLRGKFQARISPFRKNLILVYTFWPGAVCLLAAFLKHKSDEMLDLRWDFP